MTNLFVLSVRNTLGETLVLQNLATYLAEESDGFGMPPVKRLREQGPLRHGETDLGFRLGARQLKFKLTARARTPAEVYTRRAELLYFFAPSDDPLVLRVTLPDGSLRDLDCYLEAGLQFRKGNGFLQEAEIVLNAPDPTFYDPTATTVTFSKLPFLATVDCSGQTGLGWPVITLTGPWTDPQIDNLTTGESLKLTLSLLAGEQLVIDCRSKQVSGPSGQNGLAWLSEDSDLQSFHLDPLVSNHINQLQISDTGATASSAATVQWNPRYLGI